MSALRAAGASVQSLASVGKGCPDLAVGFRGVNYFLEVKDGSLSPSRRQLTDDQKDWHGSWRGNVVNVNSVDEALKAIGVESYRDLYQWIVGKEGQ